MTPPEPTEEQLCEAERWLHEHSVESLARALIARDTAAEARSAAKERARCAAKCREIHDRALTADRPFKAAGAYLCFVALAGDEAIEAFEGKEG